MKRLICLMLLCSCATPVLANWDVPLYMQTDSGWGSQKLGNCTDEIATIHNFGCALTSVAMIYNFWDITLYGGIINPGNLNTYLKTESVWENECDLVLRFIDNTDELNQLYSDDNHYPSFSQESLLTQLRYGPAILQVPNPSHPTRQHFSVITGHSNNGTFYARDPYYADRNSYSFSDFSAPIYFFYGPIRMTNGIDLHPRDGMEFRYTTPFLVTFTIKNFDDVSRTIQELKVDIHKNGEETKAEFSLPTYYNITLGHDEEFTYSYMPEDDNFKIITLCMKELPIDQTYVVRAKYKMNGVWYDVSPSDDDDNGIFLNPAANQGPLFTDLISTHTLRNKIEVFYQLPVDNQCSAWCINGYGDGTFRPETSLTRGQACSMIVRLQGWEWNPNYDDGDLTDISDVIGSDGYTTHYKDIYNCKAHNCIDWYSDDTFRTDEPLERARICKWIANAFNIPPTTYCTSKFEDLAPNFMDATDIVMCINFTPFINAITDLCIMRGLGNNFYPTLYLRRSEACKVFLNVLLYKSGYNLCNERSN